MEVLRRSSVFAAEVLDVFDWSLTDKELVSQSKALCRDYILSRLNQNGLGWSKSELNLSPSNAALTEVSLVLLCLGKTKPAQIVSNFFQNIWSGKVKNSTELSCQCETPCQTGIFPSVVSKWEEQDKRSALIIKCRLRRPFKANSQSSSCVETYILYIAKRNAET